MKLESFKKDLDSLNQNEKTENDYRFVVQDYYSREERHYCAFLFSWLLQNPENIKTFLLNFDKPLINKSEAINHKNVKLFYEFTWLRDIIYEFGRHSKLKGQKKEDLKSELNDSVFNDVGDIQKKKPDLAIYLKNSKKLILIEAKFEGDFDEDQIVETQKYGESLIKLLGENIIEEVVVPLLGRDYYLDKLRGINKEDSEKDKEEKRESYTNSCFSWENLAVKIENNNIIKDEIQMGLKNQRRIHPRT